MLLARFLMSRIYTPYWDKLKHNGTITIPAQLRTHRRWLKAISKEKNDYDLGYKLTLAELGYKAKIVVVRQSSVELELALRIYDSRIPYSAKEL